MKTRRKEPSVLHYLSLMFFLQPVTFAFLRHHQPLGCHGYTILRGSCGAAVDSARMIPLI